MAALRRFPPDLNRSDSQKVRVSESLDIDSPLRGWAMAVVAEQPDLTLKETLPELLKRRIRTSKSALSRFFIRHGITLKKKPASRGTTTRGGRPHAPTLDARARHA